MSLYIGLMSGTSMDGVDAALVSFDDHQLSVVHALTSTYPAPLRAQLAAVVQPDARVTLHELATLNVTVGRCFARAALDLLHAANVLPGEVTAIGSHGQTLRHSPDTDPPYTMQIGEPATIATRCSISTVADFRALDIAAGGQGAPLVPAFHDAYFRADKATTVVVNIGGIANITVLPAKPSEAMDGFDTGPGNCLMDAWISQERGQNYDDGGNWAATGHVLPGLLAALMADKYIRRPPPKSTGSEYFNAVFVMDVLSALGGSRPAPEDVQASLTEFTASSIASAIEQANAHPARVLVCGGGAKNLDLLQRLGDRLPAAAVQTTAALGLDPDVVEAAAFAWLAKQRVEMKPVRLTTGPLQTARLLGSVYEPSN